MEHLLEKLFRYKAEEIYPYHMPGHKRRPSEEELSDLFGLDITEIDGFDNLHHAEGILLELQQEAARLCGADESFYLVNGSTGGILAALSAAVPGEGKLLIARNCHKSVYHGAYLRGLRVGYLYPEINVSAQINEAVTAAQVEEALSRDADISAVVIVSPTYEGRLAEVQAIAAAVHSRNIPLIVDEAHGAHLAFCNRYAGRHFATACEAGADLVIQSTHKTLPALTQTAILHVNGDRIDRERLRRFLRIYQTSSPSYLLMGSIDRALRTAEEKGAELIPAFERQFASMCEKLMALQKLHILPYDGHQDLGKLVISTLGTNLSGKELYDILLEKYKLQLELATDTYVLAMFTMCDTEEGYRRLTGALFEIDDKLQKAEVDKMTGCYPCAKSSVFSKIDWDCKREWMAAEECCGKKAADFVTLYPPGIPALVPGEVITKEIIEQIAHWKRMGLTVEGLSAGRISIKCED